METITKEELIRTDPALKNRPYQLDALLRIFLYAKCLVKMFCGTGKSKIITNVIIHAKKGLSVVVFPSLALISQYSEDYLNNEEYVRHFKKHKTMNVSSESLTTIDNSTTDPKEIKKFLKLKSPKLILVTYQSYQVFLDCLEGQKIGLVCYDEAHHVTSIETQKLVFGTSYFEKEVFFTATPKNENGITMFDREYTEKNMCGPVAYDYTYLQGLNDEVLNAFEVCNDMYTDDNNSSMYTAIARAIISRNNNRVLSFHSGVNGESNTNVKNFVKETEFRDAFNKVIETEFPEKKDYYKKITFKGTDGLTPPKERKAILKALDDTPDNEIYIIASCETIGEGVDTKKANMCVFADPKSSICKIIQNIGRVVRRNNAHPLSTILIPCYVSMENYAAVKHDRVKTDELIREQMRSGKGDYECILNVLAALKQEDPELYDMCLNYPNRKVKETSLQKQGFCIADYEDVSEADLDDSEYSAEEVEQMKADGEPLEIHTNETIERFNEESEESLRRLYHDEEEDVYKPIVRITDASDTGASEAGMDADTSEAGSSEGSETDADDRQIILPPIKPKNRVSMSFHQNADVQMLWGVKGELDFSKKFCTAVIECEVTRIDQMELAIGIVERAKAREANGENLLPCDLSRTIERSETEKQEYSDNLKLKRWKKKDISNKIIEYLSENLQGWNYVRNSFDDAKYNAKLIVERARMRELNGQNLLPKFYRGDKYTNEQHLECKDAMRLSNWFGGINNNNKVAIFIKKYLDEFLPEWNDDLDAIAMKEAINIVERAKERQIKELNFLPCYRPKNKYPNLTEEHIQENKDKAKIGSWNDVIRGTGRGRCSEDIHKYLNKHLPGWSETLADKCIKEVNDLIKRANIRETNGGDLLPKQFHHIPKKERTMAQIIEYKDASKLKQLKKAVSGIRGTCPSEVKKLLDKELPGWNEKLDEIALKCAKSIIERANLRKLKGTNLLPMARNPVKNESEKQEHVDDAKLRSWKSALEGSKNSVCSDEVCKALDDNLPGWKDNKTNPLKTAQEIVAFASLHKCIPILKQKPKGNDTRTIEEKLENSYANKLADWRKALNGKRGTCSDDVRDYLDKELPGWRPNEITTPSAPAPASHTTPPPALPPPPAPPVKRKLKLKVKVPSEPKSYADLTDVEKQKICEKYLKKHQEEKGYRTTNPDDKDKINAIFAKNINVDADGKVIFLDHTEFKTANALLECGVKPEQMLIPQREENYDEMSKHELFGSSVVLGEFNAVLSQYMLEGGKVKGVYADYCSTLEKDGIPFIDLMTKNKTNLMDNAVLGVTITLRNPEGVRYSGQDITMMEKRINRTFPSSTNLFAQDGLIPEDDGPYTYGNGAPMATWLIQL
jgi:superfamily II DNA or RNA helicase